MQDTASSCCRHMQCMKITEKTQISTMNNRNATILSAATQRIRRPDTTTMHENGFDRATFSQRKSNAIHYNQFAQQGI